MTPRLAYHIVALSYVDLSKEIPPGNKKKEGENEIKIKFKSIHICKKRPIDECFSNKKFFEQKALEWINSEKGNQTIAVKEDRYDRWTGGRESRTRDQSQKALEELKKKKKVK